MLIDVISDDSLYDQLARIVDQISPFTYVVAIYYKDKFTPEYLYTNIPNGSKEEIVDHYVAGSYLLDPWYQAYLTGIADGLYILDDVAPDDFLSSDFYLEYYRKLKINNEFTFLVNLTESEQLHFAFGIQVHKVDEKTYTRLRMIAPLLISILKKHWDYRGGGIKVRRAPSNLSIATC